MYSANTCNSTCSNTTRDICFLSAYLHFLPCANLSWSSRLVKQNLSLKYSRVIKCLVSYVTTAPQCHIWSWDKECLQDNIINNNPALKSFYTVWFFCSLWRQQREEKQVGGLFKQNKMQLFVIVVGQSTLQWFNPGSWVRPFSNMNKRETRHRKIYSSATKKSSGSQLYLTFLEAV